MHISGAVLKMCVFQQIWRNELLITQLVNFPFAARNDSCLDLYVLWSTSDRRRRSVCVILLMTAENHYIEKTKKKQGTVFC